MTSVDGTFHHRRTIASVALHIVSISIKHFGCGKSWTQAHKWGARAGAHL